jgi:hypothetical protein
MDILVKLDLPQAKQVVRHVAENTTWQTLLTAVALDFGTPAMAAFAERGLDTGYRWVFGALGRDVVDLTKTELTALCESVLVNHGTLCCFAPDLDRPKVTRAKKNGVQEDEDDDTIELEGKFKGLSLRSCLHKLRVAETGSVTKTLVQTYICEKLEDLLDTEENLGVENINSFRESEWRMVLESDKVAANEVALLQLVVSWARAALRRTKKENTPDNVMALIDGLLPLIRFPLLSMEDTGVLFGDLPLVPSDQVVALMTYLASREQWAAANADEKKEMKKPELPDIISHMSTKPRSGESSSSGGRFAFKKKDKYPDGIMQHLTKKHKGNPVMMGLVDVNADGGYSFPNAELKGAYLFEKGEMLNSQGSFATNSTDATKSDVVFNFNKHRVRITAYYMVCSYSGYDPTHWELCGYNEKTKKWVVLHKMEGAVKEDITGKIHKVSKNSKYYTQLKLVRTGGPSQFVCNYLEFAGDCIELKGKK